jgi:hypothetical protein
MGRSLINGVEFLSGLDDFPGPGEARRRQEGVASAEHCLGTVVAANDDDTFKDVAELRFGEDDAPSAWFAAPDTAIESAVGTLKEVLSALHWISGNDAIVGWAINVSGRKDALKKDELRNFAVRSHG